MLDGSKSSIEESLSARRAWIEITVVGVLATLVTVALRKESVDRNDTVQIVIVVVNTSLSARRAWIEILLTLCRFLPCKSRSPQGERG